MGEPIKPRNEVVLGGVRFDANDAENYGRNVGPTKKEFFINFKDGTKVEFNQQPQTQQSDTYQPDWLGKSIFNEQDTSKGPEISGVGAHNVTDLSVSNPGWFGAYNCKDIEIEGGYHSVLGVGKCENVSIRTGGDYDIISIDNSNHFTVDSGDGNDFINIDNSNHFTVDSGDGNDDIDIVNCNNFTVDSGDGKDNVKIKQEREDFADSRIIPLPEGEVVLSPEDKLSIMKETYSSDYSERSDEAWENRAETYQVTETTMRSVAHVEGDGTHQIRQTPEEAFDTEKEVIVEEISRFGDNPSRVISTKIEDVD